MFTKQYYSYLLHKDQKVTDKQNLRIRCFTSVTEHYSLSLWDLCNCTEC